MKDSTEILLILDKSGSMERFRHDSIGGINQFLKSQKELPGEANISINLFSSGENYLTTIYEGDIKNAPEIDDNNYAISGMTALYQAISVSMFKLGQKLSALPEQERSGRVLVVILTDGDENSSERQYTLDRINKEITVQKEQYNWQFIFLASNQDAWAGADKLGIGVNNALSFADTHNANKEVYRSLSASVKSLRSTSVEYSRGVDYDLLKEAGIDNKVIIE